MRTTRARRDDWNGLSPLVGRNHEDLAGTGHMQAPPDFASGLLAADFKDAV